MKHLLTVFLLSIASLVGAQDDAASRKIESEVFNIAGELRCPVCRAESAADSSSPTSIEFRDIIREQLQDGQDRAQIVSYFQQTYGDWILLDPPRRGVYLWVWGLPVAAAVFGLGLLGYFLVRWRKNADADTDETSPEDVERVRRELGSS